MFARYAADGSEAAFQKLGAGNVNLAYSTPLRLVGGNRRLAMDVTQAVFIDLARKAIPFSTGAMSGAWRPQAAYHLPIVPEQDAVTF